MKLFLHRIKDGVTPGEESSTDRKVVFQFEQIKIRETRLTLTANLEDLRDIRMLLPGKSYAVLFSNEVKGDHSFMYFTLLSARIVKTDWRLPHIIQLVVANLYSKETEGTS